MGEKEIESPSVRNSIKILKHVCRGFKWSPMSAGKRSTRGLHMLRSELVECDMHTEP